MHQPAFPLLTYEAYLRAQLETMARTMNTNQTASGTFAPPSNATIAPYHVGGMMPIKIHVEYTVPMGQNTLQLPFAAASFAAPVPTLPSVAAASQAGSVTNGTAVSAPLATSPGDGTHASSGTSSASSAQAPGQQVPAPRPYRSPLALPRTAALREAVERVRQAAQASAVPQNRSRLADNSDAMQVDKHPLRDVSASQTVPKATGSPIQTSNASQAPAPAANSTAAPATAEPAVKTERLAPGKKALHPERHRYKIRGTKHYARWYSTKSALPIPTPPDWLRPTHGFLYVHQHKRGAQVWMYYAPDRVRRGEGSSTGAGRAPLRLLSLASMEEGIPHPGMEGYVLVMTEDDEPRWMKRASAARNRRARAREQASDA